MDEVDLQIARLKDRNSDVRRSAAEALGKIGDARAVPALIETLRDNTCAYTRAYAAKSLGLIGDTSAVPDLIYVLESSDYSIHYSATLALGQIRDSSSLSALVKAMESHDLNVRSMAVIAIGEIGDPSVIPAMLEFIQGSDRVLKHDAVEVLGKVGNSSVIPIMAELLKQTDAYIQICVAQALVGIAKRQPTVKLREVTLILRHLYRNCKDRKNKKIYKQALEYIEKATAGLKDIPITATTTAVADGLPIAAGEVPTTTIPTRPVRKGLFQRIFRRT